MLDTESEAMSWKLHDDRQSSFRGKCGEIGWERREVIPIRKGILEDRARAWAVLIYRDNKRADKRLGADATQAKPTEG